MVFKQKEYVIGRSTFNISPWYKTRYFHFRHKVLVVSTLDSQKVRGRQLVLDTEKYGEIKYLGAIYTGRIPLIPDINQSNSWKEISLNKYDLSIGIFSVFTFSFIQQVLLQAWMSVLAVEPLSHGPDDGGSLFHGQQPLLETSGRGHHSAYQANYC